MVVHLRRQARAHCTIEQTPILAIHIMAGLTKQSPTIRHAGQREMGTRKARALTQRAHISFRDARQCEMPIEA
jgi:hypothetical protein